MSEDEVQHFVRRCKPELHDFPRLAEALGAHVAPTFGQVRAEELQRASMVSLVDRGRYTQKLVVNVFPSAVDVQEIVVDPPGFVVFLAKRPVTALLLAHLFCAIVFWQVRL